MSSPGQNKPAILFTAFEPSGDALAAPIIERLIARAPGVKIYAWGGPLMEKAGATVVEQTVSNAAMGLGAIKRIRAVRKYQGQIRRWLKQYRVIAHVPVDSPAANFPICAMTRKAGSKVVHLGCPQLWAWGSWRAGKLRKRTDLVLCLLPHEPTWLNERDINGRFIGHPAVNRETRPEGTQEKPARDAAWGATPVPVSRLTSPGGSQEPQAARELLHGTSFPKQRIDRLDRGCGCRHRQPDPAEAQGVSQWSEHGHRPA